MTQPSNAIMKAERLLKNGAWFEMTLDRDERDSYNLDVRKLGAYGVDLSREELVDLLPPGSRWWQSIGWHSYFGLPFQRHQRHWLLIGAQAVLSHHKGGAYVVLKSFVFPEEHTKQVSENLLALSRELCSISADLPSADESPNRIIITDIAAPAQFRQFEAHILFHAAAHYQRDPAFNFRTLILSEDEYLQLERQHGVAVLGDARRFASNSLYCILCSVLDTFSLPSQRTIRDNMMVRFPLHECITSSLEPRH
jgi:hypothetical protein